MLSCTRKIQYSKSETAVAHVFSSQHSEDNSSLLTLSPQLSSNHTLRGSLRNICLPIFKRFTYVYACLACLNVCTTWAWCSQRSEEGIKSGTRVIDGCKTPCRCLEPIPDLREQVLLTAELFLQISYPPSLL